MSGVGVKLTLNPFLHVLNRFAMMNLDARIGAHPSDFCSGKSHQNHSLRRTTLRVPSRTRSNRRGRKLATLRHTASCFLFALRRSVARKSQLAQFPAIAVGACTTGEFIADIIWVGVSLTPTPIHCHREPCGAGCGDLEVESFIDIEIVTAAALLRNDNVLVPKDIEPPASK